MACANPIAVGYLKVCTSGVETFDDLCSRLLEAMERQMIDPEMELVPGMKQLVRYAVGTLRMFTVESAPGLFKAEHPAVAHLRDVSHVQRTDVSGMMLTREAKYLKERLHGTGIRVWHWPLSKPAEGADMLRSIFASGFDVDAHGMPTLRRSLPGSVGDDCMAVVEQLQDNGQNGLAKTLREKMSSICLYDQELGRSPEHMLQVLKKRSCGICNHGYEPGSSTLPDLEQWTIDRVMALQRDTK